MKARLMVLGLAVTAVAWRGAAQDAATGDAPSQFGAYTYMAVENADHLEGSLDGTVRRLEGNVHVVLKSDDPSVKPLSVGADEATFTYAEDKTSMPEIMLLKGHVLIAHPKGRMRADRAEWDLNTNQIMLTGNPAIDTPTMSGVQSESILIDLANGTWAIKKGKVGRIELGGATGGESPEADPSLLREGDVTDWPVFFAAFKKQCASEKPAPGKHILNLFDPESKTAVGAMTVADLMGMKQKFIKKMNEALALPSFYSEDAWRGAAISEEAGSLLEARASRTLARNELTRMNRLLLEAAFPGQIQSGSAVAPAAGARTQP